jgi:hypothetical protein
MHDGCFVTPLGKLGHRRSMGWGRHEISHAFFIIPRGDGPKRPAPISKKSPALKAGRLFHLTAYTKNA